MSGRPSPAVIDGIECERNWSPGRLANMELRDIHTDRFPSPSASLAGRDVLRSKGEQGIGVGQHRTPILGRERGVHFGSQPLAVTGGDLEAIELSVQPGCKFVHYSWFGLRKLRERFSSADSCGGFGKVAAGGELVGFLGECGDLLESADAIIGDAPPLQLFQAFYCVAGLSDGKALADFAE